MCAALFSSLDLFSSRLGEDVNSLASEKRERVPMPSAPPATSLRGLMDLRCLNLHRLDLHRRRARRGP